MPDPDVVIDTRPLAIAALIDHTLLAADATRGAIAALCDEAVLHQFACVCVNPAWVRTCARLLQGTGVRVCAVVDFPLGATTTETKCFETRTAIDQGAREIDVVASIGVLKSGDLRGVEADLVAVTAICRDVGVLSKVIIETALLTEDEKVSACIVAKAAAADFVKTSTGFASGGATAADVRLMRRVVGSQIGVKAAGGIRDLATLRALVAAGATRIGTSAGVRIAREARDERMDDAAS